MRYTNKSGLPRLLLDKTLSCFERQRHATALSLSFMRFLSNPKRCCFVFTYSQTLVPYDGWLAGWLAGRQSNARQHSEALLRLCKRMPFIVPLIHNHYSREMLEIIIILITFHFSSIILVFHSFSFWNVKLCRAAVSVFDRTFCTYSPPAPPSPPSRHTASTKPLFVHSLYSFYGQSQR